MYTLKPISDRVAKIREKYRTTRPKIDISRYRIVTEFYMENPQITGILKRAKVLRALFEQMPVLINEDEVIVGWQGASYRCSALYPETSFAWFMQDLRDGAIPKRDTDPYDIDPEDEKYLLATGDFWAKNCMSAITDSYIPRYYRENLVGNGGGGLQGRGQLPHSVGHFAGNFWTATRKGFGAIQQEARQKLEQMEEAGIFDRDIYKYNFYRAVDIVCGGHHHLVQAVCRPRRRTGGGRKEPRTQGRAAADGGQPELDHGASLPQLPRCAPVHLSLSGGAAHGRPAARHLLRPCGPVSGGLL